MESLRSGPHAQFAAILLLFGTIWQPQYLLAKGVRLTGRIAMGVDVVELDGICPVLSASVTSEGFFDGLQVVEKFGGREFRRKGRVVTHFPEKLKIELIALARPCEGSRMPAQRTVTKLLERLHFKVYWKRGLATRAVQNPTVALRRPTRQEWDSREDVIFLQRLGAAWPADNVWIFDIQVVQSDVPLTDHLIVSVLSQNEMQLVRFSAQLK